MGKPSEQIRCNDWTAGFVMDEAILMFGSFVDNEAKRYAQHRMPSKSKDKPDTAMKPEHIEEYQRALVEGTPFKRIQPRRRPNRQTAQRVERGKERAGNGNRRNDS